MTHMRCCCGETDPGACGGTGTPPFTPCGYIVTIAGVVPGPDCTGPDGTRRIVTFTGINGTHVLDNSNKVGTKWEVPINVAYEFEDPDDSSNDRAGAWTTGRISCTVNWCSANSRWYLNVFNLAATDRTGDSLTGSQGNVFPLKPGDFHAPPGYYIPALGFPMPNGADEPYCDDGKWKAQLSIFSTPSDGIAWGGGTIRLDAVLEDCDPESPMMMASQARTKFGAIPDDHDPAAEARALKRGRCCDPPQPE